MEMIVSLVLIILISQVIQSVLIKKKENYEKAAEAAEEAKAAEEAEAARRIEEEKKELENINTKK